MNVPVERTDAEILHIMDLRDTGLTCRKIGALVGATKDAINGLLGRIDRATESSKHDGTMPNGWWRRGLKRRGGDE